ncbi:MAG: Hsp20/alpha crystallin family protein [Actinomycetota bacterium]|nr:Hsp20/alpha crystallin family protein [Actinomycetota bacterium]
MALPVRDRREREAATWNPVAELEQATKRLTRLVDAAWGSGWPTLGLRSVDEFLPPADLEETDEAYVVEVELPGVQKKDVDVEVSGRRLTVSGERKERERTGILRRRTRTVGRFFYEVTLPGEVDDEAVRASLADGVLTVTVPKAASERRQRRRITVQ